jgi:hypothetical protein
MPSEADLVWASLLEEVVRARSQAGEEAEEGQEVSVSESLPPELQEIPAQGEKMEAAGIEPAICYGRPKSLQDGSGERPDGDGKTSRPAPSFTAKVTICGIDVEVRRDDQHLNLHLYEEGQVWRYEPLEQAIPKLEAILAAARMAANLEVLDD